MPYGTAKRHRAGSQSRLEADTLSALRAYLAERQVPEAAGTEDRVCEPPAGLAAYLARAGIPFSRLLLEQIRASGSSEVEIYKRAHVDRKLFSKIRSDPDYQPKKSTVIAFALALRLSPEQTRDLLASAGYALSGSAPFDLIIRFFVERGVYDLFLINDALDTFGQPILMV
ncbi:MAG: hypothetical protein WCK89_02915 [bacterium]